ncbi:hypothetical protein C6360_27330 [Bacillus wiedmannii]|nr:hypothetical protein C6360_27330 [Bacillus wiedmannii]
MDTITDSIQRYNDLKINLLNIIKCIDHCPDAEKGFYRDVALIYSNHLKKMQEEIEKIHHFKFCNCLPSEKIDGI